MKRTKEARGLFLVHFKIEFFMCSKDYLRSEQILLCVEKMFVQQMFFECIAKFISCTTKTLCRLLFRIANKRKIFSKMLAVQRSQLRLVQNKLQRAPE